MASIIYDWRHLTRAAEVIKPLETLFLSRYFVDAPKLANTVDIYTETGMRVRPAQYVNPGDKSMPVYLNSGDILDTVKIYPTRESITLKAYDRLFSRGIIASYQHTGGDIEAKRKEALGKGQKALNDRATLAAEVIAIQLLTSWAWSVQQSNINLSYTLSAPSGHTITLSGGDKWDQAGSDPHTDIKNWVRKIQADHPGASGFELWLGKDVEEAFANNAKVLAKLNNLNYNTGKVNVQGIDPVNVISENFGGVRVLATGETYINHAGSTMPYIPDDGFLLIASNIKQENALGLITDDEAPDANVKFFQKMWTEPDPSATKLLVESPQLPILVAPNTIINGTAV